MDHTITEGQRRVLRLEAACECAFAVAAYARSRGSWRAFGLMALAPDVAMIGYLAGPRIGAAAYNAAHSYVGPAALLLAGRRARPIALVWSAHIALDRMLGYGLKSERGFTHTHLGTIGRSA